jgi:hypothetical protein
MSPLPQRKKSAEEIAKLRETLGVPPLSEAARETPAKGPPEPESKPEPEAPVDTLVASPHEAEVVHHPEPEPEPAPVHLDAGSSAPLEKPVVTLPAEDPAEPTKAPKVVRSLRKSEQGPVFVPSSAKPAPDSKLPVHRHSDEQIAEIRRREALAALAQSKPNPKLAAAHPALLIPGYLCAIAGASCFVFYEFPMAATAACAAVALAIAGFVFLRRPISRHHAGFIAMIALFVLVFGALHYFPHLRNAT